MSYSVDIVTVNDVEDDFDFETHAEFHHTSNTWKMMEAAGAYLPDFDRVNCREALPRLSNAINTIILHQEDFKQYEAENGQGTIESTTNFLAEIENACRKNLNAEIRVYF